MRSIWCTAFSRTFGLRNMFIPKLSLRAGSSEWRPLSLSFYSSTGFPPSQTLSRSGLLAASGTATCLFQISRWAFGLYLQYAHTTTAIYGALSALVFFFLWLYYACTIFIISAELGWAFDHYR